jgi:23S rRNA (cytosine1962-C5)-methyltransferase
MEQPEILVTEASEGYELLDSGSGEKLERYGDFILARPDPQALWKPTLSKARWEKADATFVREGKTGVWKKRGALPAAWQISIDGLAFTIKPSPFKHTGLFPEQRPNWRWIRDQISHSGRSDISVINLFGYTGAATLAASAAGANVVHVDGSRSAISWGRENAEASGLGGRNIRWMLEDARKFVEREARRGSRYDGIIMDPPAFGRGDKGEVWKIEEDFLPFLEDCRNILSDAPLFVLLNGYASGYSSTAYLRCLEAILAPQDGTLRHGELSIRESASGKLLPAGMYARWSAVDMKS